MSYTHRLFGRTVASPQPLPAPVVSAPPDITLVDNGIAQNALPPEPDLSYARSADGSATATWCGRIRFQVPADGSRIEFTYATAADRALIFDYLLAQALSVALLQRSIEPLHATVLEVRGRGIAFLGDTGAGKSTLAAALITRGAKLLTDDLLVVEHGRAQAGAQRIKLTPEVAACTIGERTAQRLPDERLKSSYALTDDEYSAQACPLAGMFVLRCTDGRLRIEELNAVAALRELLGATFNPRDQRRERLVQHMKFTAELLQSVPVRVLHVPWDLERLRDTAREVEELLAK